MQPPSVLRRFFQRSVSAGVFAVLAGVWLSPLALQARTLTAKDGRTIEVEILAYEDDSIRIKRTDTGQTFTLPIDTFSAADQRTLRAEAKAEAAKPKPVPRGSVQIEISRGVFSSEKRDSTGLVYTFEQWGYNVVLTNRSGPMLENIRAEYILFLEPNPYHTSITDRTKFKRTSGKETLEALPTGGRVQFRTSTVEAVKVALKPGWVWSDEDRKRTTRDKLYGVWVRFYRGDELIEEFATPANIVTREKWE
jgi:hypothetical protein